MNFNILNEEIQYQNYFIEKRLNFERKLTLDSILTYKSPKVNTGQSAGQLVSTERPFSRDINPKGESIFVGRDKSDIHHHVDQIGKYEIDKIQYIPPPAIEVIHSIMLVTYN